MIDSLGNNYFFIFAVLSYLLVFIYSAYHLKLFVYLNRLESTGKVTGVLQKSEVVQKALGFVVTYIVKPLKPVIRFIMNDVLAPVFWMLRIFSSRIRITENQVAAAASYGTIEALTYVALAARRAVNAESTASWSILLAIFILFYFILTNV